MPLVSSRAGVAVRTAAACLVLATSGAMAAAPSFSGLYVFGDSLSDNGNLFTLTGGLIPSAPYFEGRFSNGPVAVELLAKGLNLGPAQFHDFAVGGASSGFNGDAPGTGMLSQVAGFQGLLGGSSADPDALYVVWGGGNDLRDGKPAATVVANLTAAVTTLHDAGAREFLLPNLPDLGLLPESRDAGTTAAATFLSQSFNAQLSDAYGKLAAQWSDETFFFVDVLGAQRRITNDSPGNGFTNVKSACISTPNCTPDTFLYWDQIHPTAAAHRILGAEMLAAVPEPGSVLMLAVGLFGMSLVAIRRRA